jgi:DNA-binding response OmpR family regulator
MMSKRILIIEDSIEIRENTAELLELSGYEVEVAADGIEGVRKAKAILPDLVICDVMMPHLDGFGVLQVFSTQPSLARIPFIFLTAKTDRSDMRKGMEMGADDYLTKPFQEVELLRAIESRLKKKNNEINSNSSHENNLDYTLAKEAIDFLDFENYQGDKKSQSVNKKNTIYSEGDSPIRIFYLKEGKVKTFHTNQEGKYFITSFIHEGEFFGFVDILEDQLYRESAEALEDCKLLSFAANDFNQVLKSNIHLEIHFRKALTAYLIKNEQVLFSMAYQSLRKRVALALYDLAITYGKESQETVVIRLSREDLASRVGTATESVIRTLSEFKKEGLLEIKGGEMTILDVAGLKDLKY